MCGNNKGQVYLLEAIAVLIIIGMLILLLHGGLAISPQTGGTYDAVERDAVTSYIDSMLISIAADGGLRDLLLYVDQSGDFVGDWSPTTGYQHPPPHYSHPLFTELNQSLAQRGMTYNIRVRYNTADGTDYVYLKRSGTPVGETIRTTYTVPLYDNMYRTAPTEQRYQLSEGAYPMPDHYPTQPRYNQATIEIIAW